MEHYDAGPLSTGSAADERLHRKQCLAAGFRLFARMGFDEGFPDTSLRVTRNTLIDSGSIPSDSILAISVPRTLFWSIQPGTLWKAPDL